MSSSRKQWLMIAGLLLLVAAIGAYMVRTAEYMPENALSATAKTPLGMNALYVLLKDNGVEVNYFGQDLALLPPGSTLVVGDDAPEKPVASTLERADYTKAALERGNTVIYLPPVSGKDFASFSKMAEEAKSEVVKPKAPEVKEAIVQPAEKMPKTPKGVKVHELPWEIDSDGYIHITVNGISDPVFAGVHKLTGGGLSPYDIKPLDASRNAIDSAKSIYVFKGTSRPFLVTYELGKGTWIDASASELFTNRDIGKEDNAVFAYNLLSQNQGKGIWFLESIHGYAAGGVGAPVLLFFSWWGQLILLLAFCLLLFFLKQMFPLGKDIETALIVFPSTLERVRAQAELWRHGRQSRAAMRFGLAYALGLGAEDASRQLAAWLTEEGRTPAEAQLLATEMLTSGGKRISPEAMRAYGRILSRHSVIRRYL
jgi:hypothetical protein